jgi:hypothetical protein
MERKPLGMLRVVNEVDKSKRYYSTAKKKEVTESTEEERAQFYENKVRVVAPAGKSTRVRKKRKPRKMTKRTKLKRKREFRDQQMTIELRERKEAFFRKLREEDNGESFRHIDSCNEKSKSLGGADS